jgi:hypothetical protein
VVCCVKWKSHWGESVELVKLEDSINWTNVDLEEKLINLIEWKVDVKEEVREKIEKYFDSYRK